MMETPMPAIDDQIADLKAQLLDMMPDEIKNAWANGMPANALDAKLAAYNERVKGVRDRIAKLERERRSDR